MKDHCSYEHIPESEVTTDFTYPAFASGSLPVDVIDEIENYTTALAQSKLTECIRRLFLLLVDEKKPVMTLQALLYAVTASIDGNGTQTHVANQLGVSRQSFHYHVKTIRPKLQRKIDNLRQHPCYPFI